MIRPIADRRVSSFMKETTSRHGSEVCTRHPNGSFSDAALHEQMTEGVDDSDFRAGTRSKLHVAGVPVAALNRLFPDLPPLADG
jgi:hypothetical protein